MDLRSLIFWRRPERCSKCAEYEDAIAHLTSIDYKADGVHPTVANAAFDGAAVKLFAASAAHWFKETGGENFVTLDMNDPKTGEHYQLTMQKAGGKTPAQRIQNMRAALAGMIEAVRSIEISASDWQEHVGDRLARAYQEVGPGLFPQQIAALEKRPDSATGGEHG